METKVQRSITAVGDNYLEIMLSLHHQVRDEFGPTVVMRVPEQVHIYEVTSDKQKALAGGKKLYAYVTVTVLSDMTRLPEPVPGQVVFSQDLRMAHLAKAQAILDNPDAKALAASAMARAHMDLADSIGMLLEDVVSFDGQITYTPGV